MLASLLWAGQRLLFWRDEWAFIFDRPDPTIRALLAPFLDTFVAVPVLVNQALLAVFGLRTYLPYLAVTWAAHFILVALLYRIIARRCGELVGLAAGLSMLFLGSGFEVMLHPTQIQYSFAAIGGLLALDQLDGGPPTRRRLAIAAVALLVAIASSGLGVIFCGLIGLWALLRRDRAAIVAVAPAVAAYAAWYFTWGRESGHVEGPGLGALASVASVVYGMGAAVAGVTGLPPTRFALVGVGLLAIAGVAFTIAIRRGYRPDPLFAAAMAALLAVHVLQTALRGQFGIDHGHRPGYVYVSVIFLWLASAGLVGNRLAGLRWRQRRTLIAAVLLIAAVGANMRQFVGIVHLSWHLRATELAGLRMIEELRDEPGLALDREPDGTYLIRVTAREYLAAIDRFGRPTLEGSWELDVDWPAVEAAKARLLAP